jgi:hypothetical protein
MIRWWTLSTTISDVLACMVHSLIRNGEGRVVIRCGGESRTAGVENRGIGREA